MDWTTSSAQTYALNPMFSPSSSVECPKSCKGNAMKEMRLAICADGHFTWVSSEDNMSIALVNAECLTFPKQAGSYCWLLSPLPTLTLTLVTLQPPLEPGIDTGHRLARCAETGKCSGACCGNSPDAWHFGHLVPATSVLINAGFLPHASCASATFCAGPVCVHVSHCAVKCLSVQGSAKTQMQHIVPITDLCQSAVANQFAKCSSFLPTLRSNKTVTFSS